MFGSVSHEQGKNVFTVETKAKESIKFDCVIDDLFLKEDEDVLTVVVAKFLNSAFV